MTPTIVDLTNEVKDHLGKAQAIAAKVETENRDFTDAERAEVTDLMGKAAAAKKNLDQRKSDDATRTAITDLGTKVGMYEPDGGKSGPSGLIVPDGSKTLGQHFIESAGYKSLIANAPNGQFGEKMRVQGNPVGYASLLPPTRGRKDLVTGASPTSCD